RTRAASTLHSTGPTRCGGPSYAQRRSRISSWPWCATRPGPRSKRASAGSGKPSEADVRSDALPAGPRALAVVGFVAPGLELALLGLLAHEVGNSSLAP